MKKLISLFLILALCCMMIPAMADEDITGEWYFSYQGMAITMTLNEDGTFIMEIAGAATLGEGTWTAEGEKVLLTNADSTIEGTIDDGQITVVDGELVDKFTREPVNVFTPAEVNPEAAMEDFNGTWVAAYASMAGIYMAAPEGTEEILTIDNGFITLGENNSLVFYLGTEPVELTYENGSLNYLLEIPNDAAPMTLSIKVEILQDGMMALSVDMGYGASTLYLNQAAAEEPAA